jgi:AmiR/NasT family two-component response regulator
MPSDIDTFCLQIEGVNVNGVLQIVEGRHPAAVGIVTYESPASLQTIVDLNAHAVISKPLRPLGILAQFALARYRHGYERRLAGKVHKLEETLKDRRLVERAIAALKEMSNLAESDAYKLLHDRATAKRIAMMAMAESIIAAHETMKSLGFAVVTKPT